MTAKQMEEFLSDNYPEVVLIGETNERSNYFPAIIGIDTINEKVIYDYDKLVSCFAKNLKVSRPEAEEWIEFNVIPSLSSMGTHCPIISNNL